jgi:hypothetical protein
LVSGAPYPRESAAATGVTEGWTASDLVRARHRRSAVIRRGVSSEKELFKELVESIKEAGQIHRGEIRASREFVFDAHDVGVRENLTNPSWTRPAIDLVPRILPV